MSNVYFISYHCFIVEYNNVEKYRNVIVADKTIIDNICTISPVLIQFVSNGCYVSIGSYNEIILNYFSLLWISVSALALYFFSLYLTQTIIWTNFV